MKEKKEKDKNFLINKKYYTQEEAKIINKILKQYKLEIDQKLSEEKDKIYASNDSGDVAIISGDNSIEIRLELSNQIRTDKKLIVIGPNCDAIEVNGFKTFELGPTKYNASQTIIPVDYKYSQELVTITIGDNIISRNIDNKNQTLYKIVEIIDDIINREIEHQFMLDKLTKAINNKNTLK